MQSTEPIMQLLQLIITLFILFRSPFSTGLVAKPGCPDHCGNLSIPFPFGIGTDCFLDPYFSIDCNTSTFPPKPYLSIMNMEVIEINQTYIRVKYPNPISTCYDLSVDYQPINGTHSMMNLSGTPYTFSEGNMLTAIGCDDAAVLQSNPFQLHTRFVKGCGCMAYCADKNHTGYCQTDFSITTTSGCCQTAIDAGTTFVGTKLLDLSRKLGRRRKLYPCSYAFIQERTSTNETIYSYPLHYLDNATALLSDDWASVPRPPLVRLDWRIKGADNCSQAILNHRTYACLDKKSICYDDNYYYSYYYSYYYGISGYRCKCVEGYEGNPYLQGGCQTISYSNSSIAKPGCQDQCGEISIPYPFGIGANCYLEPSFEIICNASNNPPIPHLRVLNATIMEINSSRVYVRYPDFELKGWTCYNISDGNGISKPSEKQSLKIDLSQTQFALSEGNWITAIGCDDMVVVDSSIKGREEVHQTSSIRSSCAAICSDTQIGSEDLAKCNYGPDPDPYSSNDGCCRASIPRGATYVEAKSNDVTGRWPRTNFSCSYFFPEYNERGIPDSYYRGYEIMNNSTIISTLLNQLWLDWKIGAVKCKEARQNQSNFACQANSDCVDIDGNVGGYLCNCSKGYQGNPYLFQGCQDIDECKYNTTTYPCVSNSMCRNTLGSFDCLCPKGYIGSGTKEGTGCIHVPQSKIKMIILIGSGLGFLILVFLCFSLYKYLKRRKAKLVKEQFFKRNGGLLLQQQTNEGALGKTRVFRANELEVATDNFNESRILGQGGQGTVYKGMLSDGKIVAVKKSKLVEENQVQQFINEVAILSHINHRNVVKLLGCCLETEVPLLVYEFMPNGTLFDLVHDPNNEFPFPWNTRLKIAADIAGALAYLHSASSMPIYHRDIKSTNILLDEKYVVKVSDFGTSRSISADQTHLTTMVKGTFGYLDPEYFQSSQFTEKSDVYSFGVVLVELLTGKRPISYDGTLEERGLATRFVTCMEENCLDSILDPQVLEHSRKEEVILVARLAQRCLNLKGKMRPTMREVATELESYRMFQMSNGANDESGDVRAFEDFSTMVSDSEYTWTGSYKTATASSSSDAHPLMFDT